LSFFTALKSFLGNKKNTLCCETNASIFTLLKMLVFPADMFINLFVFEAYVSATILPVG